MRESAASEPQETPAACHTADSPASADSRSPAEGIPAAADNRRRHPAAGNQRQSQSPTEKRNFLSLLNARLS